MTSNKRRKDRLLDYLKVFIDNIRNTDISGTAAQITYYIIISIFPFIIFFLNIISKTPIADERVLDQLALIMPDEAEAIFRGFVSEIAISSSDTLLSISILLVIWSGSRGLYAMIKAINRAYDLNEPYGNIRFKLLSLVFTVALSLLIILVLASLVFGEIIGNRIFAKLDAANFFVDLWNKLRYIIPLVAMVLIFALLYKFSLSTNKKVKVSFKDTLPGALFTSLGWLIYSFVFSFYVNNFSNFSNTYGSLGGVFILLVWLYMTSMLIVIGGEINGSYKRWQLMESGVLKEGESIMSLEDTNGRHKKKEERTCQKKDDERP